MSMSSIQELKKANASLPEGIQSDTPISTFLPGTTRDTKNKFVVVLLGETPTFHYLGKELSAQGALQEIKKLNKDYRILSIDVYQAESSSYCGSFDYDISGLEEESELTNNCLDLMDFHLDSEFDKSRGYPGRNKEGHVFTVLHPAPGASDFDKLLR